VVVWIVLLACAPGSELVGGFVEHELLVGIDGVLSRSERRALIEGYGFSELGFLPATGVVYVDLGREHAAATVRRLEADPRFRFVEPNWVLAAEGAPNDPYFGSQWNLQRVGVTEAWDLGRGEGRVVAVLDTGVSPGGSDGIHGLLDGADMVYGRDDTDDSYGHGTHVAGTIAQNTDNGVGVAGVAPGVSVLPVKVLGDTGYGSSYAIASGIEWAADEGADVINMSLGMWGWSSTIADAVAHAEERGAVVVAAAGNEDTASINFPASIETVLSVGASTSSDRLSSFTNWGDGLDLVAPGSSILQEVQGWRSWTYSAWDGTSMATPHVSAAAALVMAQGIEEPAEVRRLLRESAEDLGSGGYDTSWGHGLLDVAAAVGLAAAEAGGTAPDSGDDHDDGTIEEGPDATEPVLFDVDFGSAGGDFWITWETDEPGTTDVWFDPYGWYLGDTAELTPSHERSFTGSVGATYSFWVSSADAAGNRAYEGPYELLVE